MRSGLHDHARQLHRILRLGNAPSGAEGERGDEQVASGYRRKYIHGVGANTVRRVRFGKRYRWSPFPLRTDMLDHAPRFDLRSAEQLARDLYALDVRATALTSERDQNFLLGAATGERIVLKIANALEEPSMIDAQQAAMTHLAAALDVVPRVIAAASGARVTTVSAPDGRSHLVWAVTHRPGIPLATSSRRTPARSEERR